MPWRCATGCRYERDGSSATPLGPPSGRGFRLQWEAAQNAYVLLYPEGMIKLNASAGEIMKRCDGQATIAEITADLEQAFATPGCPAMCWRSSPWRATSSGCRCRERRAAGGCPIVARAAPRPAGTAAVAPARAHLSLSVALRVLLQPDGFRAHGSGTRHRGLDRVLREARALGAVQLGLSGGEPLVRDDLETHRRRSAPARLLHQSDHLRRRAQRAAHSRAERRGARSHPALLPGQHAPDERFPEQHAHLRSQVEGRGAHQAVRLPDGAQRGAAPAQHRSRRGDPRDGRSHGRRLRRARQYSVLRLGVAQPRAADAEPRASRARRGGDAALPRARRSAPCAFSSSCRTTSSAGRSPA